MATIKDIAKQTGVSAAAVSRVLNYDEKISVSAATRNKIFETAERLGYKKKQIYPPIGDIVLICWYDTKDELEHEYYKSIRREIEMQARERNIALSSVYKQQGLLGIKDGVSGFIAIGWFSKKELDDLAALKIPGVFVDSSPDESNFDSVKPNFDSMVKQMFWHFYAHGHKNIGLIGFCDYDPINGKPAMDIREWAFRDSAGYYKVLCENNIFIVETVSVERGYELGKEIINKLSDDMPTAFCVASDTLAIGVIQAFNEFKLDIPGRVAFFSINNSNAASYISPPLSTFHIDVPLMCRAAIDLLSEQILEHRKITKTVYINGLPIFRKSC